MNADETKILLALLPLLGVGLGWGLKEFSDFFRGASDSRRIRTKGLFHLIRLYQEMVRVERILEQVKNATGDWKLFESFRARYAEKYGDKSEDFIAGLNHTIQKMSENDPWSALELRHVLETYLSLKEIKLAHLQNMGLHSYIRGLSAIEATYLTGILVLRKLIHSEARRCGVGVYLRTRSSMKKFEKLQMQNAPHGMEADLKSLFDKLEKKKEPNEAT